MTGLPAFETSHPTRPSKRTIVLSIDPDLCSHFYSASHLFDVDEVVVIFIHCDSTLQLHAASKASSLPSLDKCLELLDDCLASLLRHLADSWAPPSQWNHRRAPIKATFVNADIVPSTTFMHDHLAAQIRGVCNMDEISPFTTLREAFEIATQNYDRAPVHNVVDFVSMEEYERVVGHELFHLETNEGYWLR